jgi:molybdopterin molybdotransferase
MLTVEEALKLVEERCKPLAPRRVALNDAIGLVLAEDIKSDVNSPPYDKALMDGYAVRSVDREPERRVLEEIAAGAVPRFALSPNTASRIMTGAPMPEGADSVVPVEQSEMIGESTVRLHKFDLPSGKNMLRLGESLRAGETVLRKGVALRAIEIGLLAEIGHGVATVIPRPRIGILPTGNELVPVGEQPASGQIRNSNGPMLRAAALRADAEPIELGIARDTHDEHARLIKQGLSADILLLSGGVSAGKFDLVPSVLAELEVEQVFHKIALRPGKPLWFGVKESDAQRTLVFALPGNPVSSLVCFELFVRPAIAALSGRAFAGAPMINAPLSHAYDHAGGRAAYLPARLTAATQTGLADFGPADLLRRLADQKSNLAVEILPWQGSADLATLTRSNALARLPQEPHRYEPGAVVDVLAF